MAKSSSKSKSKSTNSQSRKRAASPAQKSGRKQPAKQQASARQPLLDDTAHRNIVGIICVVVAIALVLIVAWPTNAVVTSFLSLWIRRLLGIGAYLLPVLLVIVAGTFVAQFESERVPTRVIIGLALIFFAVLILFALFTPEALSVQNGVAAIFSDDHIVYRGGYIGAGPAYLGLTLLGLPVSVILAIGMAAIGFVVIGFSLRKLIDVVNAKREEAERREEEEYGVAPDEPYVQAAPQRASRRAVVSDSAQTQMIPSRNSGEYQRTSRSGNSGRLSPEDAQAGETQPLTRKLGKRNKTQEDENVKQIDSLQSVEEAPLAAMPDEGFELPKMELLRVGKAQRRTKAAEGELEETAASLQQTMEDFGIMATVVDWMIPGTHFVGIEVPNAKRENVLLGDVLKDVHGGPLEMAIGKDVEGNSIICDLAKMPHLLIGGTTGSGKSVGINSMIMSMLMRATPSQVRFIMIDPKRVEFTPYNGIPHLYVPVVTEPKEAASALSWGVAEMERRLKVFSKVGARNISQYNEKARSGALGEDDTAELPYIVIIIDELADLMMNVGKEVEFSISRIAQLARAAGIHLIVATQRPSANVVTGLIKANITNRIAFNVASGLDSRVILDVSGAESLIGNGDMLLSKPEYSKPLRIQGCFVSSEEITAVVEAVKEQGEPEYHSEILKTNLISMGDTMPDGSGGSSSSDDPLIWEAAEIVVASGLGSTSNIQRKLKVGYSRAGRIMDMLEEKGIVGPPNGSKPRDVLVDAMELETLKAFEANDE